MISRSGGPGVGLALGPAVGPVVGPTLGGSPEGDVPPVDAVGGPADRSAARAHAATSAAVAAPAATRRNCRLVLSGGTVLRPVIHPLDDGAGR